MGESRVESIKETVDSVDEGDDGLGSRGIQPHPPSQSHRLNLVAQMENSRAASPRRTGRHTSCHRLLLSPPSPPPPPAQSSRFPTTWTVSTKTVVRTVQG